MSFQNRQRDKQVKVGTQMIRPEVLPQLQRLIERELTFETAQQPAIALVQRQRATKF